MDLADIMEVTMHILLLLMEETQQVAALCGIWAIVSAHKRFKCSYRGIMPQRGHNTGSLLERILTSIRSLIQIGLIKQTYSDGKNWATIGKLMGIGIQMEHRIEIEVHYDDSEHATGRSGAIWRSVGADAISDEMCL